MTMISSGKTDLVHPFHEHALTLRDLSKDCQAACLLCKQYSHGPTYCCEDCNFILHEACARVEFPPLIQGHPSHRPGHPLNLVPDERSYCCTDCGFSLGALTAIATLLPHQDIEEDTIRHFRHEQHPLSSFCLETALDVPCGSCEQQIRAGQVYGCRSCIFLLHGACARLTLEIRHPLHHRHPLTFLSDRIEKCKVCLSHMKLEESAYCCEECGFALHVRCAVLTMDARNDPRMDIEEEDASCSAIKQFSHDHPLIPLHVRELIHSSCILNERPPTVCLVCRLLISEVEAFACCKCSECRFFLHRSCAEKLPKEIQYPLHPQHPLLTLQLKDSFVCSSCQKNASDIAFSCKDCEFNLEPACAFQELSAIEDGAAVDISHFSHKHPLMLAVTNPYRLTPSDRCIACHQVLIGVSYRCITCRGVWLHRSCAEQPLELEHAFHPQHPLVLSEAPTEIFSCFACGKSHEGLAFCCVECQFYIGITCASQIQTLKHPNHEHSLVYYESIKKTKQLQCSCCGKRSRYDFYCCMRCRFSLHHDCLHLPPSVNHKSHRHPLQLRDKFVDKYKDPNDLYCDYCETIRDPDHGVYHCEECNFSAHIKCIIPDSKEDVRGSETWGSDLHIQLNIKIATRKAKIEIMRRDIEAMVANLKISVEELADIENEVEDEKEVEDSEEEEEVDDSEEEDEREDDDEEESDDEEDDYDDDEDEEDDDDEEGEEDDDDEEDEEDGDDEEDKEQGPEYPYHMHKLILRILSENCQVECNLCELEIHGPAYCCERCEYFLHGSCAVIELPHKIRHPSHRRHALTLSGETNSYAYRCNKDIKCIYFSVPALTALATMPPLVDEEQGQKVVNHNKEEEGIIRHYAHKEHPLASFCVEMTLFDTCRGCTRRISGQVVGCRACRFLLHASCARFPWLIDHPFCSGLTQYDAFTHTLRMGDCRVCRHSIDDGFEYSDAYGSKASFRIHMGCAISTIFPPGQPKTHSTDFKMYSWHSCPLLLLYIEEETYVPIRCKICELYILGEARCCPKCRVFLHKSCAENLPNVIQHYLHPDHPNLVLGPRRGDKKTRRASRSNSDYRCCCATCRASSLDSDHTFDMAFKCDKCAFYLNPKCALQTLSVVQEGVAASILHFAHDHPLLLHFSRKNASLDCIACKEGLDGLSYCCVSSDTCNSIGLHKSCSELPQELEHPFHPQHLLFLLSKTSVGYFYCSACREKSRGFAYYCAECKFYLDIKCATLNLTLKHPRHEHKLAYFKEATKINIRCNACGETCKKDLYHCAMCNFNLHYDCVPLPPVITHEGHRLHPLSLRDKFVDGDPNYQYCDHCEELRHPDHGVYHCGLCWFSAHIDCMISKDKVDAEEEATEVADKGTEREPKEMKNQSNSKDARLEVIDGSRRNIDRMRGNLKALMKEVEELEMERKSL